MKVKYLGLIHLHPSRTLIVLTCMETNLLQFGQKTFMAASQNKLLLKVTPFNQTIKLPSEDNQNSGQLNLPM